MGKQFKGTKGKWAINSANKLEINSFEGIAIADCSMSVIADNNEKLANAKLIAGSKELMEFVMFIASHEKGSAPSVGYFETIIEKSEIILDAILG